jgi:uncharacterized protein (TIGR00730 family)
MKVCIFCGANSSLDTEVEREIKVLMTHFAKNKVHLVYGGAGIGVMGSLATELLQQGGSVTGVIPRHLMRKEIAHDSLTQLHVVGDMHERKKMMYEISDAFLVLPGGMGTMDELFEILTWKQLGLHRKPIAIFNINGYYDHLINFINHAVDKGLIKLSDRSLLFDSDSWLEIWKYFNEDQSCSV